jgi:tetratricopeptide (TPR) repeat protein
MAYQHAILLNPLYSDSYFNLANIFFEEKRDFNEAENYYKKALEALDEANKIQQFNNIDDE